MAESKSSSNRIPARDRDRGGAAQVEEDSDQVVQVITVNQPDGITTPVLERSQQRSLTTISISSSAPIFIRSRTKSALVIVPSRQGSNRTLHHVSSSPKNDKIPPPSKDGKTVPSSKSDKRQRSLPIINTSKKPPSSKSDKLQISLPASDTIVPPSSKSDQQEPSLPINDTTIPPSPESDKQQLSLPASETIIPPSSKSDQHEPSLPISDAIIPPSPERDKQQPSLPASETIILPSLKSDQQEPSLPISDTIIPILSINDLQKRPSTKSATLAPTSPRGDSTVPSWPESESSILSSLKSDITLQSSPSSNNSIQLSSRSKGTLQSLQGKSIKTPPSMISLSDMIPFSTNGSKSSSPKSFHKEPFPPKLAYGEEGKEAEVYIGLHSPQQSIGKVNDTAQTFIPSNRQDMESQTQSFTEFDRTRFAVKMSQTVSPATAESSYQQLHSKQSVDKASQTVVQHDEPVETVLLCKESVPPVPTAIYSRHACLPKDCVPRFAPLVRDYSKKRRGRLPDIQYPVCSPTVFSPPNLCDCACIDYEYAIGRAGCRRPVRRCACYPTDDMAWDQCFSKVSNVRCRPEEENEGQMFGGYRYVKIVEEICHPEGSRSIDPSPYLYRTPSDFTDFNECDCCLEI